MPEHVARYAIDAATAERYSVRRYGFHGTSHAYVSRATAALLGRPVADVNVIVLHLATAPPPRPCGAGSAWRRPWG